MKRIGIVLVIATALLGLVASSGYDRGSGYARRNWGQHHKDDDKGHYNHNGKHDNRGRGAHYGGQRSALDKGHVDYKEGNGDFYFNKGNGKYYFRNYNVDKGAKERFSDKGHKRDYLNNGRNYDKGYYQDKDNYNNYYRRNEARPKTYENSNSGSGTSEYSPYMPSIDDRLGRNSREPSGRYARYTYAPQYATRPSYYNRPTYGRYGQYPYEPEHETYRGDDDDSYTYGNRGRYVRGPPIYKYGNDIKRRH
ncbi:PREDICTED: uncharacterized protein LOC106818457 [Priapulus caudatus]|uniref:Uncharacterized protein LOC106818457 n=1 Tax=Priapulus caudatus TaxID=37621 RepID=A0ABM1F2K6_PRICU|nr:PREDICTED: uncharacterized protein LOC106818457 [Priapulus caudatus]